MQFGARSTQTTLRHSTAEGLVDVAPDQITGWFWAVWRVETEQLDAEVAFGDREWALSVAAAPPGTALEFQLWEWCEIATTPALLRSGDGQFCDTTERLQRELHRHANALQSLTLRIHAGEPRDIACLRDARVKRKESWVAADREDQHARVRADADIAFRAGDFRRVIQLLGPFSDLLTPAERAKLTLAGKKSGGSPG
jgi:hypothetical protein